MPHNELYRQTLRPGLVGQVSDMSGARILSRTVAIAAGYFGAVAAIGAADHTVQPIGAVTLEAAVAAAAGNTGNGVLTMDATPTGTGAKVGVYRVVAIEPATDGGRFSVEDPDGINVGVASVGVAFAGPIRFTIADGATDFVAGDSFNVTVTEDDEDADSNNFAGIFIRSQGVALGTDATATDRYPVGDTASVMEDGECWVTAGGDVSPRSESVGYVISTRRFVAGGGDIRVPGKFMSSGGNGDVVRLRIYAQPASA